MILNNNISAEIVKDLISYKKPQLKTSRRKTFSDNEISKEVFNKLIDKVFDKFVLEEIELTQQNIIKILLPLKISNNMIAKVIKEMIPDSNPTAGSVASQIRLLAKRNNRDLELLDLIEKEL